MDKSIKISDRDFHGRIIGKYQKGKRNLYDFPLMIFFKNPGRLLSQKIKLNVLLQFNISKKITAQYILKSAEGIKSLLEWFRIERYLSKHQKVNSLASRSKDIPISMSLIFEKTNSALNRIIYPLFLNSEKSNINSNFNSYVKFPLKTFNQIQQIQQIDLIKKFGHLQQKEILSDIKLLNNNKILNYNKITNENILNKDEDISWVDNSVSWDYKFVFNNESPVILQHVNLLLKNSKLSNSKLSNYLNYTEVLNDISKSNQNKSNAYLSNYIQIINPGLHNGFEPAILPHVNLLLNNISMQGDSFASNEYFKHSKSDKNYHVILPHVNLLLKTISANNIVSYTQEFSIGHTSGDGSDHSFSQADLMVKESASDKDILQQMDIIHKNMPEMIVSLSNSFKTTIKHYPEKDYHMALSFIMPSIIKTMYKDDIKGQTSVNLEHLIKSDTSTEASIENHDLQFKTNVKIEEEMENIKRIALEAKQTVIESVKNIQTSHEEEMNRKININQLSDQVYRLLDRKITIEKERRGII